MPLDVDDVRAWLLELHQVQAAALLSEAEFDYTFIDLAFRLDAINDDGIEMYELAIRVPPRIYRAIGAEYKVQADQVEAAILELTQHTKGSWIRSTSWALRLPRLDEVESTPDVEEIFSNSSLYDVQRLWTKTKGRVANDPDGAITAARTMLESLCKVIIGENGGTFTNKDDLPTLYSKAVASLDLAPGRQTEEDYRRLAGSCTTIMNSIACIRNREGDSHATSQAARLLQAKFVVNLAGSLVTFLVGIHNERKISHKQQTTQRLSLNLACQALDRAPNHYHANMATFDNLDQDALGLPPSQRIALAQRLLSSVESEPDPDAEAGWEQEIARRIARSDAGEVTLVPATEVFARLRRIAPERP